MYFTLYSDQYGASSSFLDGVQFEIDSSQRALAEPRGGERVCSDCQWKQFGIVALYWLSSPNEEIFECLKISLELLQMFGPQQ